MIQKLHDIGFYAYTSVLLLFVVLIIATVETLVYVKKKFKKIEILTLKPKYK